MEATELRDYFAAKVLVGIYSNNEMFINLCNDRRIDARNKNSDTIEEYIAQKCYLMSDAMMKERIHDILKQTEIKRFECGTDQMIVFNYLVEKKIQVKRYDDVICTVVDIIESESFPIIMSNRQRYSKNGFFKNFTNIDGSDFFYD